MNLLIQRETTQTTTAATIKKNYDGQLKVTLNIKNTVKLFFNHCCCFKRIIYICVIWLNDIKEINLDVSGK